MPENRRPIRFLISESPEDFDRKTRLWRKHLQPFLRDYEMEISSETQAAKDWEVRAYTESFLSWPIRKLEYSYVLERTLDWITPGCKYLDCGCGVTPTARAYREMGCESYACDSSPHLVQLVNEAKYIRDSEVKYSCQDVAHLGFRSGSFDIVTCVSVLEHLPAGKDALAISEMVRVLKKGGRLICTVDFSPSTGASVGTTWSFAPSRFFRMVRRTLWILRNQRGRVRELVGTMLAGRSDDPNAGPYSVDELMHRLTGIDAEFVQEPQAGRVPTLAEIQGFWKPYWKDRADSPGIKVPEYIAIGFTILKR